MKVSFFISLLCCLPACSDHPPGTDKESSKPPLDTSLLRGSWYWCDHLSGPKLVNISDSIYLVGSGKNANPSSVYHYPYTVSRDSLLIDNGGFSWDRAYQIRKLDAAGMILVGYLDSIVCYKLDSPIHFEEQDIDLESFRDTFLALRAKYECL